MRIAYVEDNPTNLALVERICGMNHHTVVSYSEGEVAIQQLVREKFDLILMDVELAGEIGGLQVVRHLRRVGLKTPIVAVTAYAMMGDRERCLEAGCDDYLPKPLPINELLLLLAKYEALVNAPPSPEPVAAAPVPVPPPVPAPAILEPATPAIPAAPNITAVSSAAAAASSAVAANSVPASLPVAASPVVESKPVETPSSVPSTVNTVEAAVESSKPDEITSLNPS